MLGPTIAQPSVAHPLVPAFAVIPHELSKTLVLQPKLYAPPLSHCFRRGALYIVRLGMAALHTATFYTLASWLFAYPTFLFIWSNAHLSLGVDSPFPQLFASKERKVRC
jgi:hypothetical protein